MSNILTATITLTGKRPMLWHHFGSDAIPLTKQERSGVAGNDPEEWRRTVLVDADQRLYLDPAALFGCLRDAAKFTKRGRGSLQTYVASTLQVTDDRLLTNRVLPDPLTTDPTQPVYLDVRSVRNPTTRARNVRYRVAAASGWQIRATIQWDITIVSRKELLAVLIDAGRLVGLGDGRSIGFGRFTSTVDLTGVAPDS